MAKSFMTQEVLNQCSVRINENLKREFDMMTLIKFHPSYLMLTYEQQQAALGFMIDLMIIRPITSRQIAALAITAALNIAKLAFPK